MKWWPFGRQPEAKASAAGGTVSFPFTGRAVWTPRDFEKLAEEAYVRNAVAFRCTKLIASSLASVPWLLTNKAGGEIEEHPLLDLLARPNAINGGHELFEAFVAYMLLAGNTYLEAVGPTGKAPRELWVPRPDRMKAIAGDMGIPSGWEYEAHGRKVRWDADPVTGQGPILHMRDFHPLNDWYGMGRVEPAAYGIDRHNAASAHNKALLDNGARPSGALVFKPIVMDGKAVSAPDPVLKAAEERLKREHGGAGKAGNPFVFGGDVTWQDMSTSPKDMDFQAGKEDAARDICLAFGVPHILIVPGASTYNNVREAKLELWEDTNLPLLDRMLDKLNAWLVPQYGERLRLGVDMDEIPALEYRRESKRKSVVELLDKGVLDANEAREALQYGPRNPNAVQKVDAAVLRALVDGYAADHAMFTPLFRYLHSVGLVAPGTTPEDLLALAEDLLGADPEEDAAAQTPGAATTPAKPTTPNQTPDDTDPGEEAANGAN